MTKERLVGAIKVGFAQGRVDYTEAVYDDLICLETEGESRSFRRRVRWSITAISRIGWRFLRDAVNQLSGTDR